MMSLYACKIKVKSRRLNLQLFIRKSIIRGWD